MKVPMLEVEDFVLSVLMYASLCEFEVLEEYSKKYKKLFDKIADVEELKTFSIEMHEEFLQFHPLGKDYIKEVYGERKFLYI